MILVTRAGEPALLPPVRLKERLRTSHFTEVSPPTADDVGNKYRVVADDLWEMQQHKCCYCEKQTESSFNDVEHFRPKARADRHPGADQTYGYWWLAWSWENLLFSCQQCNRSAKNDQFPLSVGSGILPPRDVPPGFEQPLLIDPSSEDPIDLIQFVPKKQVGDLWFRWIPIGRNGSDRGQKTAEVLKLDRPELLELYDDHVRDTLIHDVRDINEDIISGSPNTEKNWARITYRRLNSGLQFSALTYDVFDFYFPLPIRSTYGLVLNRPARV